MSLKDAIKDVLDDPDFGKALSGSLDNLSQLVEYQASQLIELVGLPGYDRAVLAARDIVLMKAGLSLVDSADALDARMVGLIQASIGLGARILAGGRIA